MEDLSALVPGLLSVLTAHLEQNDAQINKFTQSCAHLRVSVMLKVS